MISVRPFISRYSKAASSRHLSNVRPDTRTSSNRSFSTTVQRKKPAMLKTITPTRYLFKGREMENRMKKPAMASR